MYMNPLTLQRPKLQSAVLKYFLSEEFGFENVTLLAGTGGNERFLDVGTVVGQIVQGAVTVSAAVAATSPANTGNGTIALGAPAFLVGTEQVGTYQVVYISATEFEVYDPSGKLVGVGKNASAFSNQIVFTATAGGTPFVAGDSFGIPVAVAAGGGQFEGLNLSGTDGSQNVAGVVMKAAVAQNGADNVNGMVVLARGPAVLLADGLIWPGGITGTQQAAALAQLLALNIVVRNS